ncbi:MAG: hypothetical protein R3249_08660 [Nitriliruptorales bacterium]|nr:hypothetical protein [Nitriliruptorales bacterium]
MGKSIDELEQDVRAIQDDLARDLDVLASRLPNPENIGRVVAAVAAAALTTWLVLSWLLGTWRRARERGNIKRAVREVLDEG